MAYTSLRGGAPGIGPGPALSLRVGKSGLYLEGQGDLVNGSIIGISRITIWVIGVVNLLTKSP